jgi:isopenicillin N synthase-like dioxygenase
MGAISESLGLKSDYIQTVFKDGIQIGVLNLYPQCPEPDETMGIAPHSDHGGLTILLQNDVGGLQVRHEGRWVAVEPSPNAFVVNVSDHLEVRIIFCLFKDLCNDGDLILLISVACFVFYFD